LASLDKANMDEMYNAFGVIGALDFGDEGNWHPERSCLQSKFPLYSGNTTGIQCEEDEGIFPYISTN